MLHYMYLPFLCGWKWEAYSMAVWTQPFLYYKRGLPNDWSMLWDDCVGRNVLHVFSSRVMALEWFCTCNSNTNAQSLMDKSSVSCADIQIWLCKTSRTLYFCSSCKLSHRLRDRFTVMRITHKTWMMYVTVVE